MTAFVLSTLAALVFGVALTIPMLIANRRGRRPRPARFAAWCWLTYALAFGWILTGIGQNLGRSIVLAVVLSATLLPLWLWTDRRDRRRGQASTVVRPARMPLLHGGPPLGLPVPVETDRGRSQP